MPKAVGLIARLHDVAMVGEAVQQRGSHLGVAEDARPFGKRQVGGNQHAGVFIELGQQVKQQGAARLAERQVTQLIEDDQVHAHQAQGNPARLALRFFLLQGIDQIDRGVKPHALGRAV